MFGENGKYGREWEKYDHKYGYDKREYDIKLYTGETIFNCYPNVGIFRSYDPNRDTKLDPTAEHLENNVVEIRLSENEVLGINY